MRSSHALIFDMDGVLINTEEYWENKEKSFFADLFGSEILSKLGDMRGVAISQIYTYAKRLGAKVSEEDYYRRFDEAALRVYQNAEIARNTDLVIAWLEKAGWEIGLLSSSPQSWIDQFLSRVDWGNRFTVVLSINKNADFRPKPAPDGYLGICQLLKVEPAQAVAVEDSRPGIAAAQSAGLLTVGYREFLKPETIQTKTAITVANMAELIAALPSFFI